jgi:hypothetical protein
LSALGFSRFIFSVAFDFPVFGGSARFLKVFERGGSGIFKIWKKFAK